MKNSEKSFWKILRDKGKQNYKQQMSFLVQEEETKKEPKKKWKMLKKMPKREEKAERTEKMA